MTRRSIRRQRRRAAQNRRGRFKGWISVLVIVVVLLIVVLNRQGLGRLYRFRAEQARLELEIAALRARAKELTVERARLETDLAYIERLAREKYRMVKRGEKVFRVIPNSPPTGEDGDENDPH